MPFIVVQGEQEFRIPITAGKAVFVGRAKECDICLPYPAVSRRHAVIMLKNDLCGLKDLNSYNGTTVNGKRVSQPVRLYDGDQIRISKITLIFHAQDTSDIQVYSTPDSPKSVAASSTTAVEIGKGGSNLRLPRALAMAPASESAIMLFQDVMPKQPAKNIEDSDTQTVL